MLDVACHVAKPSVVAKIMTRMGVDGHVVAAWLKEMRDTREVWRLRKLRGQLQVLKMYQAREGRGVSVAAEDREYIIHKIGWRWRGEGGGAGCAGQEVPSE